MAKHRQKHWQKHRKNTGTTLEKHNTIIAKYGKIPTKNWQNTGDNLKKKALAKTHARLPVTESRLRR